MIETAFDDDSAPVNSVGFDYPDDGEPVENDTAPNALQLQQLRQLIIYLLEGGHDESWKTRAAAIATMLNCDGWETTQKAAQRLGIDDSAIRKAKGKLKRNFLAREELREIRAKHAFFSAN